MTCDKCEESKEQGYKFCPVCGTPLTKGCVYCAQYEKEGYEYCGKCGNRLEPRPASDAPPAAPATQNPLRMAPLAGMPFFLILLGIYIIALIVNIGSTWDAVSQGGLDMIVLTPGLSVIGTLTGIGLQTYFILILIALLASVALVMYQSRGLFDPRGKDVSDAEKTPLYWIILLFCGNLILSIILVLVQFAFGFQLDTSLDLDSMDIGEMIVSMMNAAVWEEIACRVLWIGVPMALLALCYGKKDFLRNLLGGFGMSRYALILLVISSLVFGYAHLENWSAAKFIPTMIGGFIMGYLYIRFGIHAAIFYHFFTDFLLVSMDFAGEIITAAVMLILMVVGLVCLVSVLMRIHNGVKEIPGLPVTGMDQDDSRNP